MIRRSVPFSKRWVLKLWRRVWTVTRLFRPAARAASRQARAKKRQISEEDLFELEGGKPTIPTCPMEIGTRILERSSCAALAGIRARFYWLATPRGASGCDKAGLGPI